MKKIIVGGLQARSLQFAEDPELGDALTALRRAGHSRPLAALAAALSRSPPARTLGPDAVMAIRERPEPLLVISGRLDRTAEARVAELPSLLREAGPRLRIFTWTDVEAACEELAAGVRQHLGQDRLEGFTLVGIPRGGLLVAGLLAYALGIPRSRIRPLSSSVEAAASPAGAGSDPVILVDDCVISGVRLRQALSSVRSSEVVVATLCSHPELRSAVEQAEPRVTACLAGVDLRDHGEELLGSEEKAWRARWKQRVPQRYHTGLLDLVSFPWSEPEIRMWNPVTGEMEPNWWLAPPEGCLEHRSAQGGVELQITDNQPGVDRLAASVVPVTAVDEMTLIDCGAGRGVRFSGTALELWRGWVSYGLDEAVERATAAYGEPRHRVRRDLMGFIDELQSKGFLANDGELAFSEARPAGATNLYVQAAPGQVSTDVDGHVVIMQVAQGEYLGLDKVGARIWELVREGGTLEEMEATLVEEYEVEPERCRRDLRRLIDELEERELVEVYPADSVAGGRRTSGGESPLASSE